MKRKLACLLVCVMTLGLLAACGQKTSTPADSGSAPAQDGGESGGSYKIGYSMPMRDQFQTSMEKAIQAKAEAEGIEINILDAASDVSAQISHVQT